MDKRIVPAARHVLQTGLYGERASAYSSSNRALKHTVPRVLDIVQPPKLRDLFHRRRV